MSRLLPLQLHAAIEALTAPLLLVVPFALGFDAPALVGAMLLAALLMGSALQASGNSPRVSAHVSLDLLVLIVAAGLALAMSLLGSLPEAAIFASVVVVEASLTATTRYTQAV